jgi:hypothetical protein
LEGGLERNGAAKYAGPSHATLRAYLENYEDVSDGARKKSELSRDYYDGKQWTDTERKKIEDRKQPVITVNKIKRKINYLVGLEIKTRTDPKVYPVTPKHEADAQSVTDALRYAATKAKFEKVKTQVIAEMLIEGGPTGCYVGVKKSKSGVNVTIKHVPWDRCFADPHSREKDYSDARYSGIVNWMDEDEALAEFPEAKNVIETTISEARVDSKTYDDRPRWRRWVDVARKRVRIVELFYLGSGLID